MDNAAEPNSDVEQPEPRWHAALAAAAAGVTFAALPADLSARYSWLFPAVVSVLLVFLIFTHAQKFHRLNHTLGFILNAVLTLGMVVSVIMLVKSLTAAAPPGMDKGEIAKQLLVSAALLWLANVIVFALWYWRLDAGGPHKRERRKGHQRGAFLFPQMTMPPEDTMVFNKKQNKWEEWSPNFVDYLFIAFNTSTAFSPTDVPVLDRWAKVLMIVQSVISLTVIALLAARAINTLA